MKRTNRKGDTFTVREKRAVFSLSSIIALRMFGLFMLLPVLALYSESLAGNSLILMGWALGAYGLTQAAMQIPFGILSDHIDRKLAISLGLIVFASGSVVAANADTIQGLIVGRGIQGSGAVSAAILAMTADLTRSSQRTKAMAVIGISIGASFVLSLLLAPVLEPLIGVRGMFWGIAILAILAIVLLYTCVPQIVMTGKVKQPVQSRWLTLINTIKNPQIMHMNLGIFFSHMVLTSMFLVIPFLFKDVMNLPLSEHWKIYLPVLVLSLPGLALFIHLVSSKKMTMGVYRGAIMIVLLGLLLLATSSYGSSVWIFIALIIFFTGFNTLESMMPSLVSRMVNSTSRGSVLSIYSTFQYLGIFVGGVLGGWVLGNYGRYSVFWIFAGIVILWLMLTQFQPAFLLRQTLGIDLGSIKNNSHKGYLIDKIRQLDGVDEISIAKGESVAYLEVNPNVYNSTDLDKLLNT